MSLSDGSEFEKEMCTCSVLPGMYVSPGCRVHSIQKTEHPETLYIVKRDRYPFRELGKVWTGEEKLEDAVTDNGKPQTVAVYQLVEVRQYKKKITTEVILERSIFPE